MKTKIWALLLFAALLAGCTAAPAAPSVTSPAETTLPDQTEDAQPDQTEDAQPVQTEDAQPVQTEPAQPSGDLFTDRDFRTEYGDSAVRISLNGDTVDCDAPGVTVNGTTVTITGEAAYVFSGTLNNGKIVVDAGEKAKPQLVFDGVSVTSADSAPLCILEADKVFVTLAKGSENTLVNAGAFSGDDQVDGAVFSRADLTFNGQGSLNVSSPAGHGIVCKDDLVFTGGSYTVEAASHALDANDSVRITDTNLTLHAGMDGIHAENNEDEDKGFVAITGGNFQIDAQGDGISAGAYLEILDGSFRITAGGGSENGTKAGSGDFGGFMGGKGGPFENETESDDGTSMKGLKSAGALSAFGGSFELNTADDAIHSDASVQISAGTFRIASGDDAIHGETNLTVSGGVIEITESYEGLEAEHIVVSGGKITLTATDDGLNAAGGTDSSGFGGRDQRFGGGGPGGMSAGNGSILISGGEIHITASGDGIDANGTLEITGGTVVVCGPTRGDTASLDYDKTGIISGGTFIATGGGGMAQTFSDSQNQGVLSLRVGNAAAGTEILLQDADGREILRHTPELDYQLVILSSPEIRKGERYTIIVGQQSGEFEAQ